MYTGEHWRSLVYLKGGHGPPWFIDFQDKLKYHSSLLETRCLQYVLLFAVCFLSGTRQRATLTCATTKTPGLKNTHGKFMLCRVFFCTRQKHALPCVFSLAHDKVNSLPCVKNKHMAKHGFGVYFILTHGKIINFFLLRTQNFFYFLHITCCTWY